MVMSDSTTSTRPRLLMDLSILPQEPISPEGFFLATELRAAHDRHIQQCNDNMVAGLGDYEDVYGLAMVKRLSEKLQQCLAVEDKYGSRLESFQRLHYERYYQIYHLHYPGLALQDLKAYPQREKWRDLFRYRRKENARKENLKIDDDMCRLDPKAEHMSKLRDDATEALRCLTYLTREEPCEEVYDALEQWVFWNPDWESTEVKPPITRAIVVRDLENIGFRLPRDMAGFEVEFQQAVSSALKALDADSNAAIAASEDGQTRDMEAAETKQGMRTPSHFWISRT